jgi:NAD+ diphosphatase
MEQLAGRLGGFYPHANALAEQPAFVVLMVDGSVAVPRAASDPWWPVDQLAALREAELARVAVGYLAGCGHGEAWQVSRAQFEQLSATADLVGLRDLVGRVAERDFGIVSRATQLLGWQRQHRFCGGCGAPTQRSPADHGLVCGACQLTFYPRISPCIITLVHDGDYCLLGRQAAWPGGLFSTLAGFIEPGESAEQALCREVMEESGVAIADSRYFASQAWPFPSQLMLGYFARYGGGEVRVDGVELQAAEWFHYRDLPRIPPPTSISGQLIRSFVDARHNGLSLD